MTSGALTSGLALLALALPQARAVAQSAAADSTLAAACAAGGGLADGLLVVVFRSDLPETRLLELAREAGGRLGGEAPDGGRYVILPPEGRSVLDAVADRLIRQNGVESVGGVGCPPPPAAADSARSDSAAADSSRVRSPSAPADSLRTGNPAAALPTPLQ